MYVRNPRRDKDKLGEAVRDFLEALKALPYAKTLIERRNYIGLIEYFGEVLSDMEKDKRLQIWLETFGIIDKKLDEYLSREPLNKTDSGFSRSRPYARWCERKGFLLAQLNHAHNECMILRETVLVPNKRKMKAIEVLREHVDDYIADHPRRLKKLKDEHDWKLIQKNQEIAAKKAELTRLRAQHS